jgi:hypothetical protein
MVGVSFLGPAISYLTVEIDFEIEIAIDPGAHSDPFFCTKYSNWSEVSIFLSVVGVSGY